MVAVSVMAFKNPGHNISLSVSTLTFYRPYRLLRSVHENYILTIKLTNFPNIAK